MKCDCGGHKANTTHSDWCSSVGVQKKSDSDLYQELMDVWANANHISGASHTVTNPGSINPNRTLVMNPDGSFSWHIPTPDPSVAYIPHISLDKDDDA